MGGLHRANFRTVASPPPIFVPPISFITQHVERGVRLTGPDLGGGQGYARIPTSSSWEVRRSGQLEVDRSCRRNGIGGTPLFDGARLDDVIGDKRVDVVHRKDRECMHVYINVQRVCD